MNFDYGPESSLNPPVSSYLLALPEFRLTSMVIHTRGLSEQTTLRKLVRFQGCPYLIQLKRMILLAFYLRRFSL